MWDFDPPCINIIRDITDMKPIASNSIRAALNLESLLHHIAYPQKALDETYRVLKPNGLLGTNYPYVLGHHVSSQRLLEILLSWSGVTAK